MLKEWWSLWEEHDHYVQELVDLGGGVIFTVTREDGHFKGSHGRVEQTMGHVGQWIDSLCVRHTIYLDLNQARTAAERLAQERAYTAD